MPMLEAIDFAPFQGTVFAHERSRVEAGEPWAISSVAGLQFYSYGDDDDLVGRVMPALGDPVALMRRPTNAADERAIEVWWRNRFKLGHLPRGVAYEIAPGLDEGLSCRGYVLKPGSGEPWSMRLALVGAACKPFQTMAIREAAGSVWPRRPGRPTVMQRQAADAWCQASQAVLERRREAATYAFTQLLEVSET